MKRRTFLALASVAAAKNLCHRCAAPELLDTASPASAVRFIAVGDAGTGNDQQNTLARLMTKYQQTHSYDTALLLGDNIYPDGDVSSVASKFERPYADLLHKASKFHAVLGNHDARHGREGQPKYPHFNMDGRTYYSFTKGDNLVGFFGLDSNEFDRTQRQWLETQLAASQARWKVVYFHHPIYSSAGEHGSNDKLRAALEPMLVKYGVNAVFSGHDHTYERTRLQQACSISSPAVAANCGVADLDRRSPFFATGNDESGSFMLMEATPERFSFKAIDVDGRVFDSGELAPRASARNIAPSQVRQAKA
jgi:acid phosphatase